MEGEPILYIQNQRELSDGRIVVSGPSYFGAGQGTGFHWTSGREDTVRLFDIYDSAKDVPVILSCSNPKLLSSAELFGYDPFSAEHPVLREFQNYSSAMISVPTQMKSLLRFVMLPEHVSIKFFECRIRLILEEPDQLITLLHDLEQTNDDERVILRWENSLNDGFLLFPAKCLLSGLSDDCKGTFILPKSNGNDISGRLFYLKAQRQAGSRRMQHQKTPIGRCLPV